MFVRVKWVKKRPYGYLVKNIWTKKGPRQKVVKYIGPVHEIKEVVEDKTKEVFSERVQDIITGLIVRELTAREFVEGKRGWYNKGEYRVHPKAGHVLHNGKPIAIRMNEGFMCRPNLKELRKLVEGGAVTGIELANGILEAGIHIEKESFVQLFERITSQTQN